ALTNYMSVKVTYDPSANQWQLFNRDDGSTAFADPTTGTLTSLGTGTNSTYTGTAMSYSGVYWQGSTSATQTAFFDNLTITVADAVVKPEPSNQPTNFAAGTITTSNIPLTWTAAAAGTQAPDGYLIRVSTGTVSDPVDGTALADDTDLSDGVGVKNI